MDIVFIHGNYPAQFRHLAAGLGQTGAHRVIFLTTREDAEEEAIPGVIIRKFTLHRQPSQQTHYYIKPTEDAVLKGQAVLRALLKLVEEGVQPRLVISHAGNGLGLFVKDFLPLAIHIGLFEWYFQPHTSRWLLETYELNEKLQTRMRNLPILEELNSCDLAIVPTQWQKAQFPKHFQHKLNVVFDGIDSTFFQPDTTIDNREVILEGETCSQPLRLQPGTPVLSYATRGMEPLRGFPEFMRSAAKALSKIPNLQVIVAGRDRRAYSYDAPSHGGSWKQHLLNELGDFEGRDRLHFMGLMPYVHYRTLLQRSTLHCYFTRPYVTSWSLFEAAACGARLCVSRGEATKAVVANEEAVNWVDLDNPKQINNVVLNSLMNPETTERAKLRTEHQLPHCLDRWQNLINSCFTL